MSRQRGFTLIELLAALAVSALLIGLVYGTVLLSQRSAHAVQTQADRGELMRIGWHYVERAISRALPTPDPANEDSITGFVGEPQRLVFIADQPAYLGPGGLTRITVAARRTADGEALVLRREPLDLTDDGADALGREAELVPALDTVSFRYLGLVDDGEEPQWLDRWSVDDSLPGLIEMRVEPVGEPAWPVLLARPQFMIGLAADQPLDDDTAVLDEELSGDLPPDLMEPPGDARP
jgi:general secretion pathway protein J